MTKPLVEVDATFTFFPATGAADVLGARVDDKGRLVLRLKYRAKGASTHDIKRHLEKFAVGQIQVDLHSREPMPDLDQMGMF